MEADQDSRYHGEHKKWRLKALQLDSTYRRPLVILMKQHYSEDTRPIQLYKLHA
jgi:hypothetical protein